MVQEDYLPLNHTITHVKHFVCQNNVNILTNCSYLLGMTSGENQIVTVVQQTIKLVKIRVTNGDY